MISPWRRRRAEPPDPARTRGAGAGSGAGAGNSPAPGGTDGGWLRPGDAEDTVRPVAGRFTDANAATGYLGCLLDVAAVQPAVHRGDGDWWVTAEVRLSLARELVELSGGAPYVAAGDLLRRDRGWGRPPAPAGPSGPEDLPRSRLAGLPIVDLVVTAGLRRRPATPHASVTVLVPAAQASSLLRRAADLQLVAAFRPVRLRPLFTVPSTDGAAGGSLIQVRLRASSAGRRQVPTALLNGLDGDPRAVLLREAADELLVQHDRQSPLSDRQLASLVDGATWVIADPPFGCWSLEPLGAFADAASLITVGPAHRLEPGDPAVVDAGQPAALPKPIPVTVVPAKRRDAPVDAVLLRDADLDAVRLMLVGHPLADAAFIVPGRDHHLLLASGGVAERIPLGRYLTSVAPQPVYLPHGWRTDPPLPASLYAELAGRVPGHALVLEPDRTLVFDLALRRPVWELWAGPLPAVDLQLPDPAGTVIAEVARTIVDPLERLTPAPAEQQSPTPAEPEPPAPPVGGRPRGAGRAFLDRLGRPSAEQGYVSWRWEALDAELSGNLRRAARLHEDNGSPLNAARLYERAAFGDPGRR